MTRKDVWRAAALTLALGISTSGVVALAARGGASEEPQQAATSEKAATGPETVEVQPGVIRLQVDAIGTLTPTRREPVRSPLTSPAKILSIRPSGTRVKKGDEVVVLDVSALHTALIEPRIKTESAKARYEDAKLARELAEIAVTEYDDGIYPQDKAFGEGEIQIAKAKIARSEEQVDMMKRLREESARLLEKQGGAKSPADLAADQEMEDHLTFAKLSLERDRLALDQAKSKLEVLEKFTRHTRLKELQSAVQKALVEEKAREWEVELERAKEAQLEKQIAARRVLSPVDGVVAELSGVDGRQPVQGEVVQERQTILLVQQPDGRMAASAPISEAQAMSMRPGQPAKVTIAGGPGHGTTLDGAVTHVLPSRPPLAQGWPAPWTHSVLIALEDPPAGAPPVRLHAGGAVQVEFTIESAPDALGVPRGSLLWHDGAYHVGVRGADGAVEWREVATGLFNDETVEIRSGLKPGEAVVVDPDPLLTDDLRRRIDIAPLPPPSLPPVPGLGGMGGGMR